jgi:tetratricopeptide (TPR) repeat protein
MASGSQQMVAIPVLRGSVDYLENAVNEDEQHSSYTSYDLAIWGIVEPRQWPQDYNLTLYLYVNPLKHPYYLDDIQLRIRKGRITAWDKRPCNLPEKALAVIPQIIADKLQYLSEPDTITNNLEMVNTRIRKQLHDNNIDFPDKILKSYMEWYPGKGNGHRNVGYIQLELDGRRHISIELDKTIYKQLERYLFSDKPLRWPLEQSSMVMPDIAIETDNGTKYLPAATLLNTSFDYTTDKFLIGILPFKNLTLKSEDNWIGYGLEYLIENKLSTLEDFQLLDERVVADALASIDSLARDTSHITMQSDIRTLGYNLGISGDYSIRDNKLTLDLMVINTLDGDTVAIRSYRKDKADLIPTAEKVVRDLLLITEYSASPTEDRTISNQVTSSLAALESFCHALIENEKSEKDYDKIIEYYRSAIETDPQFWEAFYNLGITYYNTESYSDALSTFDHLIDLFPGFGKPYLGRGLTHFLLDNRRQAERDFQVAIRIDPYDFVGHYYLGRIYILEKRHSEAIAPLQQAVRLNPDNAEVLYQLGNSFYGLRKYKQALPYFKKSVEKSPDRLLAQQKLGECYYHVHNFKSAKEAFSIVLAEQPDKPAANFMLGITVYKQAILDEFIGAFLEMFKINIITQEQRRFTPVNVDGERAEIFREMIKRFKKAYLEKKDFFEATFNLAMTYKEIGRVDSALAYYKRTIQINPKSAKAHLMLGKTYELSDQRSKALEEFKHVLKLEPGYFVNDPTLGEAYHNINLVELVTGELEAQLKADPHDVEANLSLARIYYAQGFYGRAANLSRRVLSVSPDNENAKKILAQVGRI